MTSDAHHSLIRSLWLARASSQMEVIMFTMPNKNVSLSTQPIIAHGNTTSFRCDASDVRSVTRITCWAAYLTVPIIQSIITVMRQAHYHIKLHTRKTRKDDIIWMLFGISFRNTRSHSAISLHRLTTLKGQTMVVHQARAVSNFSVDLPTNQTKHPVIHLHSNVMKT